MQNALPILVLGVSLTSAPTAAAAADYLTEMPGQVFTATGDAATLGRRAKVCVGKQLSSGIAGGQVIQADDGTTIVAANAVTYLDGLLRWNMRSRVTIETRDGRFRIGHAQIERFNDGFGGWQPVGKWTGSGWAKAAAALQRATDNLAQCISEAETW